MQWAEVDPLQYTFIPFKGNQKVTFNFLSDSIDRVMAGHQFKSVVTDDIAH